MIRSLLLILFLVSCGSAAQFKTRRIKYARCEQDVTMPKAVFMTCAEGKGTCQVKQGENHTLTALFRSKIPSSDVHSNVAWNNYFPIPLPGQENNACLTALKCPVRPRRLSRFKYVLAISDFWPKGEFPVKWTLSDKDTDEDVVCFRFKILII